MPLSRHLLARGPVPTVMGEAPFGSGTGPGRTLTIPVYNVGLGWEVPPDLHPHTPRGSRQDPGTSQPLHGPSEMLTLFLGESVRTGSSAARAMLLRAMTTRMTISKYRMVTM